MQSEHCDVLIIGAGPGGYVCGIRAGQLGLNTIILEEAKPGGTCLNVGCIPSKALIHAADEFHKRTAPNAFGIASEEATIDFAQTQSWKNGIVGRLNQGVRGLLKKSGARLIEARAEILDGKTVRADTADGPVQISCKHLVLATGSRPSALPHLPLGGDVISSSEALALTEIPKTLAVVGGGYIGLEIGTAMAKLGTRVTVVEAADRILPQYDAALTTPLYERLVDLGINLHLEAKAAGIATEGLLAVTTRDGEIRVPAHKVLVTVGRTPNLHGFGLESLGLTMDGAHIQVDDRCATSMREVYAIGDITGAPMLAHRAMAQGVVVAEHLAGQASTWDKRSMPAICFTDPEIVVVGDMPSARAAVSQFPYAANGRAMTMERTDGFIRVVHDRDTELILGIQAVGAGVSEMAGEFSLAIEMCATLTDLADTIHAHPTMGEAVQDVSHLGLGHALAI